jgi:hypothetical protein
MSFPLSPKYPEFVMCEQSLVKSISPLTLFLSQTCRTLHRITFHQTVWHQCLHLLMHKHQIPIPATCQPISQMSAENLEALVTWMMQLELNWSTSMLRFHSCLQRDNLGYSILWYQAPIIPGGWWLVTATWSGCVYIWDLDAICLHPLYIGKCSAGAFNNVYHWLTLLTKTESYNNIIISLWADLSTSMEM